jgi:putative acetyltransferase
VPWFDRCCPVPFRKESILLDRRPVEIERADVPIGFMGLAGHDIAALFLEPARRGQGGGRQLVAHAQEIWGGDLTVDVNEENPAAIGFYEALGFTVVSRSPLDDNGRPFPILHMRRMLPTLTT